MSDVLPESLKTLQTRALLTMKLDVKPPIVVGATPSVDRRVGVVSGGSFKGERLAGQVIEGGADWQELRRDGALALDVRLILKTEDDALISLKYWGLRHGPADIIAKIAKGESVDPTSYYFRIHGLFETSALQYDWLNRIVMVGTGHRRATGPVYSLFEVL